LNYTRKKRRRVHLNSA